MSEEQVEVEAEAKENVAEELTEWKQNVVDVVNHLRYNICYERH